MPLNYQFILQTAIGNTASVILTLPGLRRFYLTDMQILGEFEVNAAGVTPNNFTFDASMRITSVGAPPEPLGSVADLAPLAGTTVSRNLSEPFCTQHAPFRGCWPLTNQNLRINAYAYAPIGDDSTLLPDYASVVGVNDLFLQCRLTFETD